MPTSTSARCTPAQRPPAFSPLCQRFPTSEPLASNLNLSRDDLIHRIGSQQGTVYCYVLTTVKDAGGVFVQVGSAPNFQGGLVTLCTCKGQMRAGKEVDAWRGIWIAGITGAQAGPLGRGYLFYLMRVARAFASHGDLWEWMWAHAPEAAKAKSADKHPLGDVYHPRDTGAGGKPFDPSAYILPHRDHPHRVSGEWLKDVDYRSGYGRRPALLVGDPYQSFLWSEPRVPVPFPVGRGSKIATLAFLFS